MTEQPQPKKRYRVNTSISVKGQITWDCTVEFEDCPMEDMTVSDGREWQRIILAESDDLVAELKKRYPNLNT